MSTPVPGTRPRAAFPLLPAALLAVVAMLSAGPARAAEKTLRLPIVDRSIELHGGEVYDRMQAWFRICSLSGCFDVSARWDGGLYEHVVEGRVGDVSRRVRVTNDSVERWDDGEPVPLDAEGEQSARDFVNARIYFAFLPRGLNDGSTYKEDLGLERWGDRDLHKVKVSFEAGTSTDAGDEYLYWFDPESGRLEQFAYDYGSGDGAGLRFRRLREYRRVGGVLVFDQENLGAEAPDISVDVLTPRFVKRKMRHVSDVRLKDLRIEPLE